MCGILFMISCDSSKDKRVEDVLLPLVSRRGPDGQQMHSISLFTESNETLFLHFYGTVLHLRGELTQQPLISDSGHVFLWNGEIFDGGIDIAEDANDTSVLFDDLCKLPFSEEMRNCALVSSFEKVQGPWAFVFYDALNRNLWYGRDFFGRRSLLTNRPCNGEPFLLSSVGHKMFEEEFAEVPAKILYCMNLDLFSTKDMKKCIKTYQMQSSYKSSPKLEIEHRCLKDYCNANVTKNKISEATQGLNENGTIMDDIYSSCIKEEVCARDITKEIGDIKFVPKSNVAPCQHSVSKPCTIHSSDNENSNNMELLETVRANFLKILEEAVRKRVNNLPREILSNKERSKVGILFSGGIDSVVLTSLADRFIPPGESIDLINVAFAQKVKVQQNVKKKHQKPIDNNVAVCFDVPDRITGREALKDLTKGRQWNFVEVDVTLHELQDARSSTIANLVYPLQSVLDDSIGCAIWFAARGIGTCYNICEDNSMKLIQEKYISPVKVLLTGMGADEQLGGYARHRTKFESNGWTSLKEEMNMELDRISSRNLGRDDRCISDHGREARFPFLDEEVALFLQQLPVCVKCDPRLPRGYGEKILLREVASSLGLHYASNLPKRAIQFGSKIAKMESNKEKGSDCCKRLDTIDLV